MGMLFLSREEITERYLDFRELQGRAEALRSYTVSVYKRCIGHGLSREDAIAISEINEADIPAE